MTKQDSLLLKSSVILLLGLILLLWQGGDTFAMKASPEEMRTAHSWAVKFAHEDKPFSFIYGEQSSSEFLKSCHVKYTENRLGSTRLKKTVVFSDPKTGLTMRAEMIEYTDYPVIEWTLYFKNNGTTDTPILSNIQALDTHISGKQDNQYRLHHYTGSSSIPEDFEPHVSDLLPNADPVKFAPFGGRSSNGTWPYFNVEGTGEGIILALGWPGQWAASFAQDEKHNLNIRMGQELTHLKLHPGEEIRTPLIVMQFWKGDSVRAQNIFRRWMVAYNIPRPGGKLPKPQFTPCSSHQYHEMVHADEASQIQFIDRYMEEKIKPDYWWMDAGWYPCQDWFQTGTWEIDKNRFPNGFKPISDHAHKNGVKIIVWFEPERATPGTWLFENHPEWLLSAPGDNGNKLLNLGNTEARKWLTNHVDQMITREGIDLYRQDFNMEPLSYWRTNDAEDRQGIAENKHITGYLAYWDELRHRHTNLLIDSCASGGRRNDIETLRRGVPLLRSDYIFEPVGQQGHTYGLSSWVPFYGTGMNALDTYSFRSAMCPGMIGCWDFRKKDLDYPLLRKLMGQWRQISKDFLADYYPLTPYSLKNDTWIAWQFNSPEHGEGFIQAFKRDQCDINSSDLKLQGLDPKANYTLENLDTGIKVKSLGSELMKKGLTVTISEKPGSALFTYKRTAASESENK